MTYVFRFFKKPLNEKIGIVFGLGENIISALFSWCPIPIRLSFGKWMLTYWDVTGLRIRQGCFETNETYFIKSFLKPGMIVFDIGSHNGYCSLLSCARVGPNGRVVAFEPSPRERKRLKRNIFINLIRNIKVESSAVGNYVGRVNFFIRDDRETGCNSIKYFPQGVKFSKITVPITTLDDYLQNQPKPDFIKIDAEGAEPEILKGAYKLLRGKKRPTFLIELTLDQGVRVCKLLKKKKYDLYFIGSKGKLLPANLEKAYGRNLVAIP